MSHVLSTWHSAAQAAAAAATQALGSIKHLGRRVWRRRVGIRHRLRRPLVVAGRVNNELLAILYVCGCVGAWVCGGE